jgi:pimeloyl-ACP methyl ester carboxylesterase
VLEQRGTGLTADRLPCEVFSPALLADGAALERSVARCARRARARGLDLQHFGTADAALDLRDLRAALGVPRWDLYGISYGTRLAQAAAQADPGGVRRLVLDSVSPLGRSSVEDDVAVRRDGLRVLARRAGVRGLAARLRALDRRPLDLGGQPLTGGTLGFFLVNAATWTRATDARVPAVLRAALRRDVRPFAALLEAAQAGDPLPRALAASAAADLLGLAVVCGDDAPTARLGRFDRDPVGRVLTRLARRYLRHGCAPLRIRPRAPSTALRADVPALLLAGTIDPVTPPAFADVVARGLPRAEVLRVRGQAHGVLLNPPVATALRRTVAFLDRDPHPHGPLTARGRAG